MAVSPSIHWVILSFPPVLNVLPGGPVQVEADYVVVGLHTRGDGAESGVVDGGDARDAVCGLKNQKSPMKVAMKQYAWAAHYLCEMGKAVVDDLTQALTPSG